MATFNTAFGSLPGTNDALGTNNNTKNPVSKAPAQAKPAQAQVAQTFAQMQAAGQARPAPPAAQQVQSEEERRRREAAGSAPETPEMLQRLQQSLNPAAGVAQDYNAVRPFTASPEQQADAAARAAAGPTGEDNSAERIAALGAVAAPPVQQQAATATPAPAATPTGAAAGGAAPASAPSAAPMAQAGVVAPSGGVMAPAGAQAGVSGGAVGAPAAGAPSAAAGTAGSALRDRLLQTISQMQGGQAGAAFAAQSAAKRADLESEFKTATERLQESLAARGLSASTFGANQEGTLLGGQARALSSMEADLMSKQAEMDQQERQASLTGLTNLTQLTTDMEARAAQLVQEAALQGRSLDLQAARDQVQRELGFGELGLKRDELAQNREMESARMEETRALRLQNLGLSTRELDQAAQKLQQDAAFQGRTLDLQQARDLAEVDYRSKQLQLEDKRLTYEEARDIANREIDRDRNQISRDTLTQNTKDNELDRQLRDKLGMGQLEVDRLRATQEGRAFLVQLAQLVGVDKLTPEQLSSIGMTPRTSPVPTPSPVGSGAGGADTSF